MEYADRKRKKSKEKSLWQEKQGVKADIAEKWKKLTPEKRHQWMVSNMNEICTSNSGENSGASKNIEKSDEDKADGGNLLSRCHVASFSEVVSSFSSRQSIILHEKEYNLSPTMFSTIMGVKDGGTHVDLNDHAVDITNLRAVYNSGPRGIHIAEVLMCDLDRLHKPQQAEPLGWNNVNNDAFQLLMERFGSFVAKNKESFQTLEWRLENIAKILGELTLHDDDTVDHRVKVSLRAFDAMLGCIGTTVHTSKTPLDSFQFDGGHALDLTPIPREEEANLAEPINTKQEFQTSTSMSVPATRLARNRSEIIVSTDDQFISRHNIMSLLPNTAPSGEILTMIAYHLTLCEWAKRNDAPINCRNRTRDLQSLESRPRCSSPPLLIDVARHRVSTAATTCCSHYHLLLLPLSPKTQQNKKSNEKVPIVARSRTEGELGSAAATKRPKSKPLFFFLCNSLTIGADVDSFAQATSVGKPFMPDFHKCQKIYVPINDDAFHWFLFIVNVKEGYGEVWDPLPNGRSNRKREQQAERIHDSQDDRGRLAVQLIDSAFNEAQVGLLAQANVTFDEHTALARVVASM
ncbi:hypothetical protein WN944_014832 [Citrus x changshan-huyou]|uniref:Ubiquitin-like protease family profile domain-containing protein n=1 Tax=Citrus x changshan-huyou TaxID=2935761 RepID=A0AAP0QM29_9ROSI